MTITINGSGTITGASTLATTVASPTFTTPNIDSAQFATVSGTAPIYPCRAWVNFNGTGTVAIRASGNVSSITDNGTADYTANFTNAMPDINYSAIGTSGFTSSGVEAGWVAFNRVGTTGAESAPTTTAIRLNTIANTGSATADQKYVYVGIFR